MDFSDPWVVDRLRVLAVKSEPAEPSPGDTAMLEGLVVSPDDDVQMVLWFACLAESADDYGCEIDTAAMESIMGTDLEQLSNDEILALQEELEDAGLIGAEPYLDPSYSFPADLLDGMSKEERQEGVNLFIQIAAVPQGAATDSDIELAYKRIPVSRARTPNDNPEIQALAVDGFQLAPGSTLEVDPGETYQLDPVLADDAIEDYYYLDSDGEWEIRTEEPYFEFYLQEGGFDSWYSLYPESSVSWTAPVAPLLEQQTIWIVVKDRRGGMNWWTQTVTYH